jgi:ParB family chromosome partitioning protein
MDRLKCLRKLVEIFETSRRFTELRDPSAAITWARELMGVSKKLLVPTVIDAVVKKVNDKRITNSKDLRKLRTILADPVARAHFVSDAGDLESAQLRIRSVEKESQDQPLSELGVALEAMKNVSWTTLQKLKGDEAVLRKLDEAENLLKSLRRLLSSE